MSTTALDASLKMYESDLGKDVQKSRTTPVDEEKAFGSQIQMSTESGWSESPENPLNWPSGRKWASVGVLSFQAFISPLASSIMAPGLPEIGIHYGIQSQSVIALTLSIYILAWAVGPLLFAPFSEIYGRKWILIISNVVFLAFNIACIFAPNTGSLIAFRFIAGLGASTPISIGGSLVGDLFVEKERAGPSAASFLGVLLGPPTGPIMGGYIAQTVGFKYSFVVTSALAGVSLVLALLYLQETYGPVVRARVEKSTVQVNPWRTIWVGLVRPIQHLYGSMICLIFSLYAAIIYGILNMFFTTFPTVFSEKYGFGPGATGLTYIGGGIGELSSAVIGGMIGEKIYHKLTAQNGGVPKPEYRIPAMFIGSVMLPIGLFWYGWSAQADIHWIMPILGATIFGFGLIATLLPIQMYFIDAFTYSASALAASSALRFSFGFAFPLFGSPMIDGMGLGGAYSLLAGIMLLLGVPFPIWVFYRGGELRRANRWSMSSNS